jgi:glycosyltransferase involved in cell wall biosynthesis
VREAIDSALAQTYPNVEILVINDGSTDDGATHDIAMSYGDKIRYFQKGNGGVVSALNFGIENMHGEYFAWLSHDDFYLPEKIDKQINALKKYKGKKPAFCICNCTFINEDGEEVYKSYISKDNTFDKPRCCLFLGNLGFNGIMVLIPKILFDICGKFTPSLATHEYDMWLRMMAVANVVVEPEYLSCMRLHTDQVTSRNKLDVDKEIDSFIGKGIQEIPYSEFQAFVLNQINEKGMIYVFDVLNGYMSFQNFPYTAFQILEQLRSLFNNPISQMDAFYKLLLGHSEIAGIKNCFTQRIHDDTHLILIYCDNVTDDIFKGISMGIELLAKQYEIILFYQTIEAYHLQLLHSYNITAIKIMNTLDFNMPLRLSLISYMLNAKVFWYNADNRMQCSKVFYYLDIMEVCSIASFHSKNRFIITLQDSISNSSLITSHTIPSSLAPFQNIIILPDDDSQAFERWEKIFDVLLNTNEFYRIKNSISKYLSSIIETIDISKRENINNYIMDFFEEVNKKAIIMDIAYEQRKFWKLTKPLRFYIWFFRKVIRTIKRIFKEKKSFRSIIYHLRLRFRNRKVL